MPGALGSIGNFFTAAAPAITGASAGAGIIGNILNSITRGKAIGQLESAEKKFANLSPEQLSGLVTRAEAPLSQDLLENVGNLVQSNMASRGLAQAPGIFAAEEAQAIAPYKLQEQQKALELVMKQLGLPIEYAQAILSNTGGGTDVSRQLLALILRNQTPTTNQVPDTSGIPSDVGSIIGDIISSGGSTSGGDFGSTQPGGG